MTVSKYVIGYCRKCNTTYCVEEDKYHEYSNGWRYFDILQQCCSLADIISDDVTSGKVESRFGYGCTVELPNDDREQPKKPSRFDLLDMDGTFDEPKPEPEPESESDLCQNCGGEGKVLEGPDPTSWYTCPECLGTGRNTEKKLIIKVFGVDFDSAGGALTLDLDEVADSSKENGEYKRTHSDGWTIKGEIHEDYYTWVNKFEAHHPKYGRVYGNFEDKVYADSEAGFKNFMKNHAPHAWDYGDI